MSRIIRDLCSSFAGRTTVYKALALKTGYEFLEYVVNPNLGDGKREGSSKFGAVMNGGA
jgi:hypothetical protein